MPATSALHRVRFSSTASLNLVMSGSIAAALQVSHCLPWSTPLQRAMHLGLLTKVHHCISLDCLLDDRPRNSDLQVPMLQLSMHNAL